MNKRNNIDINVSNMETNEIRYFLAVAKHENIHRASEEISVSPGSLSKAIKKLENELQVNLFEKVGRNIKLTDYGRFLKTRSSELLNLESTIKTEIIGEGTSFVAKIGGSEALLSQFAGILGSQVIDNFPMARIEYSHCRPEQLFSNLRDGELGVGLTTYPAPQDLCSKKISSITFKTYISKKHPLAKKVKKGPVKVAEVLEHSFVVPQSGFLGHISGKGSLDGWRDDRFPRKTSFKSTGLKTMLAIVESGLAFAHLPEYLGESSDFIQVEIENCPHVCKQNVYLLTRNKKEHSWINLLF